MKPQKSKFQIFFYSRGFILFGLVLVGLLALAFSREYQRQEKVNQKIAELKQEAEELRQSNFELAHLINYLKTDEYIELEARKTLGLKKRGEKAVVIKDEQAGEVRGVSQRVKNKNWQKWLEYFGY